MNDFYFSWTAQKAAVDFPVAHAEHDEFVLNDGRRIYDAISTSFQANFGHSEPTILNRIQRQLQQMPIASPKSTFELKQTVSQRLNRLINLGNGKIFYTLSGAEAVENALKIARQITGRKVVLARQKSYHGASLGALSVTGDWRNGPHLTFDEGTIRIPEHDHDHNLDGFHKILEQTGPENIAAVILETISGTNGMSIPHSEWFAGIQDACRKHGIMLIMDEVLVGFGRCGPHFAFHGYQLEPDMVCMSKAISGGYIPFGALWTSDAIAAHYHDETLACGLTNYGHPLGLAALEAVLDLLDDERFQAVKASNENKLSAFAEQLKDDPKVNEVRLRGMMLAVYLNRNAITWQEGFNAGIHLYGKANLNIFAPPYNTEGERVLDALNRYKQLLET